MNMPVLNIYSTGLNIRKLRKSSGITVERLAEIMSISKQAVYKWERGLAVPTIDNLVILASVFKVSIDDILIVYERKVG